MTNPFIVKSPEDVDPAYISKYFVEIFTDFAKVQDRENTFIHGARGTGKSMMLRSLEATVMVVTSGRKLADLPHFGVHVPLRKVDFGIPELRRPAGALNVAVGEHFLSMHIIFRVCNALQSLASNLPTETMSNVAQIISEYFQASGGSLKQVEPASIGALKDEFEIEILRLNQYLRRIAFGQAEVPYLGALTGFLDFLVPVATKLRSLPGFPDGPFFIMLDDADNLPKSMQRIINSWVSTRSGSAICLKISTQLGYATYRTLDQRLIESPHDFSEININSVYTSQRDRFNKRLQTIVSRRLEYLGISSSPAEYFPDDEGQRKRLEEISREIRQQWLSDPRNRDKDARGATDSVTRRAVPYLMRELSGSAKSSHTYSYAGFDSLVDLSSGVIRWFLEVASTMYAETVSDSDDGVRTVTEIPVRIQDSVIQKWSRSFAEDLLRHQEEKDGESDAFSDRSLHASDPDGALSAQLHNLISALGRFFRSRLLDEAASEQRVFSIVVRGKVSEDLRAVLDHGIRLGYLQQADNAAKEAVGGRYPRYILARRLGPYFKLDVSGYAAHLSVTAEQLRIAAFDPAKFIRLRAKETEDSGKQLTFLEE